MECDVAGKTPCHGNGLIVAHRRRGYSSDIKQSTAMVLVLEVASWPVVCLARTATITRGDATEPLPAREAATALDIAGRLSWSGTLAAHEAAWTQCWSCSDVAMEGDPTAQQAIRFALYHLNGAANSDDEHVLFAAGALAGDDHRGHVFWDTQIYLLPFYILTWPLAARALLMYRFTRSMVPERKRPNRGAGRTLRLGVGGYGCRVVSLARHRPGSRGGERSSAEGRTAHQREHVLRRLAILAGNRGRWLHARRRRRDSDRDCPVLVEACAAGARGSPSCPRRHWPGQISRVCRR
jgi:hypothetical protein